MLQCEKHGPEAQYQRSQLNCNGLQFQVGSHY